MLFAQDGLLDPKRVDIMSYTEVCQTNVTTNEIRPPCIVSHLAFHRVMNSFDCW
jgi:hypothetical protein